MFELNMIKYIKMIKIYPNTIQGCCNRDTLSCVMVPMKHYLRGDQKKLL